MLRMCMTPRRSWSRCSGLRHEAEVGIATDRHVREVPAVEAALLDHEVGELVGGDLGDVLAGGGGGERDHGAAFAQAVHGRHDAVVGAGAPAGVGGFLATLDADGGADVAQLDDPVGQRGR